MMMKPPPPGPLAPSQVRDDKFDFLKHPLDGWAHVKGHDGRTREVRTRIGTMRLTVLRAGKKWGFSIRLVTPVEGVVLREWVNWALVPCDEMSEVKPWGWRPYGKAEGAEFRYSPGGIHMGYVYEETAIISEVTPRHDMRTSMQHVCFYADSFSRYPIPEVEPATINFKPTKTQKAIIDFLNDQDQRQATHWDVRTELCHRTPKVTSPSGLTMSLMCMEGGGLVSSTTVDGKDGWQLTAAVPTAWTKDDYEEEVMADFLGDM